MEYEKLAAVSRKEKWNYDPNKIRKPNPRPWNGMCSSSSEYQDENDWEQEKR